MYEPDSNMLEKDNANLPLLNELAADLLFFAYSSQQGLTFVWDGANIRGP
jgi:hypothetical protein